MSDRTPKPFREHDRSDVGEYRRIKRLSDALRAYFAALPLHDRYALLTTHPFRGLVHPGYTEAGEQRRMPKAPEYPSPRRGEVPYQFKLRIEDFKLAHAAYKRDATEYCHECIELIVQAAEKLKSDGEYYDVPKHSSLQIAEDWHRTCTMPVFAALLIGRDWAALLPPVPALPPGAQTSLF
jgi:hypothetical protein